MQYLIIAILLSVLISSIFKMFDRYRIDTFQAIVANYIVCVIAGVVFIGQNPFNAVSVNAAWFPWSLLMGCGFIGVFTMLAFGIKINGMTTTTIANKLSLVIPVLFSVWLYKDQMGIGKVAGILNKGHLVLNK